VLAAGELLAPHPAYLSLRLGRRTAEAKAANLPDLPPGLAN
jgi:hypothetical protein